MEIKNYDAQDDYNIIKDVEGDLPESPESSERFDCNNLAEWRKYLWALAYKKKRIIQITQLRDSITEKYNSELFKQDQEIKNFERFLTDQLLQSEFKTKTGGFKIDQIQDLPALSLSKPKMKFAIENDKPFLDEFKRIIPERVELDKSALNDFIKKELDSGNLIVDDAGKIINPNTGEILAGISVEFNRTLKFDVT